VLACAWTYFSASVCACACVVGFVCVRGRESTCVWYLVCVCLRVFGCAGPRVFGRVCMFVCV